MLRISALCTRHVDIPDRSAIVTFRGKPAGRLEERGNDTRFLYNDGWAETIACALPAETQDHYWRGGLHPFFEHLGPEGWLRGRQARAGGTADQDDFGILLNYGADCIGAVGVRPDDDHVPEVRKEPETIDEAAVVPGRTLSGVQKKLLAYHDGTGFHPAVKLDDPATHIAKFNREDLPSLVLNESSTLQLGREVLGSGEITKADRGQLRGFDGIALLVERFDRDGEERLRLEDFAQILSKPRGRDFNGKYQSSYEEAATVVEKHSARSRIDLARYFNLVVFNFVVGNADAHLKNFSLLERPEGLRLSPAYDLVNTIVYPDLERSAALEIGGRKRSFEEIDRTLLENFGRDIALPERAVKRAIDDLTKRFASAPTLKPRDHVQPGDFRETYRETIINNAERMLA
jgi:serine/threonine-protein kinase HipA